MTDDIYSADSRPREIAATPSTTFSAVDNGMATKHNKLWHDELPANTDVDYMVRLQRTHGSMTTHHAMTPEDADALADQLQASAQIARDRREADLDAAREEGPITLGDKLGEFYTDNAWTGRS